MGTEDVDDLDRYRVKVIFEQFNSGGFEFWSRSDFQAWVERMNLAVCTTMDYYLAMDGLYETFFSLSMPDAREVTEELQRRGISEQQLLALYTDPRCRERLGRTKASTRSRELQRLFDCDLSSHYRLLCPSDETQSSSQEMPWAVPRLEVSPDAIAKVRGKTEQEFVAEDVALLLCALWEAYAAPELKAKFSQAAAECGSQNVPEYYHFVEKETARLQAPIFEKFGIPPLPKGLRILRRLSARYEKAGHEAVCHLALQCRLALGVEHGLLIDTQSKRIPFFRQTDHGNCLQTNLQMILKWYFPGREFPMQQLDQRTGRTDREKWTSTVQAMPLLWEEGLDAHFYTCEPLDDLLRKGESYFVDHFGEDLGTLMLSKADLPALNGAAQKVKDSGRYTVRRLSADEIDDILRIRDHVVVLLVDYNRLFCPLQADDADYSGHFITLIGTGTNHFQLHDSLGDANKVVEKAHVMKAWDAPGTDNDVIVISGINVKGMAAATASDAPTVKP